MAQASWSKVLNRKDGQDNFNGYVNIPEVLIESFDCIDITLDPELEIEIWCGNSLFHICPPEYVKDVKTELVNYGCRAEDVWQLANLIENERGLLWKA